MEEVRKLRESAEELSKPVKDEEMEDGQTTMAVENETRPTTEESKPEEPEAKEAPKEDEDMNDDGGHEVAY